MMARIVPEFNVKVGKIDSAAFSIIHKDRYTFLENDLRYNTMMDFIIDAN